MKITKTMQSMHQKKCGEKENVYLLLIGIEGNRHYVLIKDFNTFMHGHTLHYGGKDFCCSFLQVLVQRTY